MEIEISGWKGSLAPPPPLPPQKKAGVTYTDYERCFSLESCCWLPPFHLSRSFHFCAFTKERKKEAVFWCIRERVLTKCNVKLTDLLIVLFPLIPLTTRTFWKRQTTVNSHE